MDPVIDAAEIARLVGLSREHVTDRLIKRPDFPKTAINISQRTRFWRRSDVLALFQRSKATSAGRAVQFSGMSKMFLNQGEVAELTGMRTGAADKTLSQRQIEALQVMRVPHYVNPRGQVMVPRASVEQGIKAPEPETVRRGIDLSKVR